MGRDPDWSYRLDMFYMHHNSGLGWGWWVLMTIGMIGFWALIVYGIVWLARGRDLGEGEARSPEPPEQILKRRLAQGEISIDEYERLLAALREPPRGVADDQGASATPPVSTESRKSAA